MKPLVQRTWKLQGHTLFQGSLCFGNAITGEYREKQINPEFIRYPAQSGNEIREFSDANFDGGKPCPDEGRSIQSN